MKTTIIILIVLAVVIFGAYFIFFNNNSYQNTPTPAATTPETIVPAPAATPATTVVPAPAPTTPAPKTPTASNVSISIKNFAFSPSTITVKVGTKVTWTNNDSVAHTPTSDSGTLISSPTLSPGQSYSVIFTNPGSISYHCAIHPMMRGTVVVTN